MATHKFTRRGLLKAAGVGVGVGAAAVTVSGVVARLLGPAGSSGLAGSSGPLPNIIIFFTDDQGYADLGCFGSGAAPGALPAVSTPNIDNMAAEGVKFTDFYVSASVCSASRASLLTGSYCERVGVTGALYPGQAGLDPREITIANLLKAQGYATACIGKWHLGDLAGRLPTDQGFDYYFGIPYSNDLYPGGPNPPYESGGSWHSQWPALPLMEGTTIIERNPDQTQLTRRYTQRAYQFIRDNKDGPFFLYVPHAMPHTPVFASDRFRGTNSTRGVYGDCMAEVDWSVGVILNALSDLGIDNDTLVMFTSDNGPWLIRPDDCRGCAKPLRDGKWSVYEGGMRVPCVMRWPGSGHIPAGTVCSEVAATIDILPTLALLGGTTAPTDRVIDGEDIWPLMSNPGGATSPHDHYFMRTGTVRASQYKLHTDGTDRLFDLSTNVSESNDAAAEAFASANPGIADPMRAALTAHNADLAANSRPPYP